jgi:hypothetical protein
MSTLSADDLRTIAKQLHDVGTATGQFRLDRIHDGAALEDPGIVQLLGWQFSLLGQSSSFALQAASVTLTDADRAAVAIKTATGDANAAIDKADTINKVVTIASSVTVLVAATMTGNMEQIFSAAGGVKTAITG